MKLNVVRNDYRVAVVDSRKERSESTLSTLRGGGFQVEYFQNIETLKAEIEKRPPHVILFHRGDEGNPVASALDELYELLPESHFMILTAASGLSATWREWGDKIYDCILNPPVHPLQLIQAIERAAQQDAYMYRAEDLGEKLAAAEALLEAPEEVERPPILPAEPESLDDLRDETERFLSSVMAQVSSVHSAIPENISFQEVTQSSYASMVAIPEFQKYWYRVVGSDQVESLVKDGIDLLAEQAPDSGLMFLRYLPNRRCLVATAAQRIASEVWKGLGINLHEEPEFRISDLRHPLKISGLRKLGELLGFKGVFWAEPMLLRDEVYGLWVVFSDPMDLNLPSLESSVRLFEQQAQLLDYKLFYKSGERIDASTQLLNRAEIQAQLAGEMVRARRLKSPVSLLLVSLDQYREILSEYGIEEATLALRALGKIIQPRSRLNDTLGRVSTDDLALILPHTNCQGAAIKAEKIRRLVAAADFSQLLPRYPHLTVTIGVSEYPSSCRDVSDLFSSADDALWQVKNKVSNKVCVATPISGFVPDFQVSG